MNGKEAVIKTIDDLYSSKMVVTDSLVQATLVNNLHLDIPFSRTYHTDSYPQFSKGVLEIYDLLMDVDPMECGTKEEYIARLNDILSEHKFTITEEEYNGLSSSLFISSYIIDLYLQEKAASRSWWKSWGKCACAIGGAITGGLGGGAAGSVIPGLGTTAGIVVGGIGGGLSGAAAGC